MLLLSMSYNNKNNLIWELLNRQTIQFNKQGTDATMQIILSLLQLESGTSYTICVYYKGKCAPQTARPQTLTYSERFLHAHSTPVAATADSIPTYFILNRKICSQLFIWRSGILIKILIVLARVWNKKSMLKRLAILGETSIWKWGEHFIK